MLKKKVCAALWQAMQDPNSEDLYDVGLSLGRVRFWADRILCSRPRPSVGNGTRRLLSHALSAVIRLSDSSCYQGHP